MFPFWSRTSWATFTSQGRLLRNQQLFPCFETKTDMATLGFHGCFYSMGQKFPVPCLDAGVQQIAIAGAFVHLLGDLPGDVHRTQLNRLIFFKVIRGVGDLQILMGNELNGEMTVILWWFYWSRESNWGEMILNIWIWIVILWWFHWELWWIVGKNYGDTTITDKNQTWPAGKSLNQLSISTGKSSN